MIKKIPYKDKLTRKFSDKKVFIRSKEDPSTFYLEAIDERPAEDYQETKVEIKEETFPIDPYYD